MRRAEVAEGDVLQLQHRCADLGVAFRMHTDSEGDCTFLVDGQVFAELVAAQAEVEQLERVLG